MVILRIKKAQAGLEFLTTYAWAFVVILIVIGALAYFGVTNPTRILPDRCNMGSEFGCENYILDDTNDVVRVLVKSNLGDVINLTTFAVTTEDGRLNCQNPNPIAGSGFLRPGSVLNINVTCDLASVGLVTGQKEKVLFTLTYYDVKSGPTYTKSVTGEIFSTVR